MTREEIKAEDFDKFDKQEREHINFLLDKFRGAERRIRYHTAYQSLPKKKLIQEYNAYLWVLMLLRDLEE